MLIRKTLAMAGVSVLLGAGLVTSTPTPATSAPQYHPWGATRSADHVLRPGCHNYPFRYRVDPPTKHWLAEIFLVNPRGVALATTVVDSNSNPARGVRTWRICRPSTVAGVHRMKMRISYCKHEDCRPDPVVGLVKPTTFRLTRSR